VLILHITFCQSPRQPTVLPKAIEKFAGAA
jgi:hypothetical protein